MKCKICEKEYNSIRAIGSHIKQKHKITTQEYYDKYLRQENEGICPVCKKQTNFINLHDGYRQFCCKKCAYTSDIRINKIKETNLKKYGVENIYQLESIKQKAQQNSHTNDAISKMLNTKKEKYGYSAPFENKEIHKKAVKKCRSKQVLEKRVETFLNNLDKFEVENNCTRISKLIDKYGQGWLSIKDQLTLLHNSQYTYVINSDIIKIIDYVNANHISCSNKEKILVEYIKSIYNGTIIENTRQIIKPLELDIYIPDLKLAIEFNGIYWHSSLSNLNKQYHYNKSKLCEEKGIRLIHIYENEMNEPQLSKIKLMLNQALNLNLTIYARNCEIKKITNKEAKILNEKVHLQGHRNAQVTYGLFYHNELVQLMSFSKTKYNRNLKNDNEWEIIRGCPGSNISVVGGVSKLLSHFIKDYKPSKVFSYCDFNKFDGKSYELLGMKCIGYTGPDKNWVLADYSIVKRNPKKYKELKEKSIAILWGSGSKKYLLECINENN